MIILLALPLTLTAQRHVALDDVVVVANRKMKDVGVEKTVIDTLALRDNISLSMADILSKNSTLFVKTYGRATESTAEFRGTSPSHTQVTWNGMRINSPMMGTVDFSTIPSYFIDNVTLYHGGSSINITGGGLGGAVEMATEPVLRDGLHGQYVFGIGSFKTYDQFLRLTYHKNRWSLSTRIAYATSDNDFEYTNYDKKVDVKDEYGYIIDSYHPKERNKSGYFKDLHLLQEAYYDMGHYGKLGLNVWYTYNKRGLPFLSVDYKDDADFVNEQRANTLRNVLSWNMHRTSWNLQVKGGYTYHETNYNYYTTRTSERTNITNSQSYTNTAFLSSNFDWDIASQWLFTAGTSVYYNHVKSADKSPYHSGDNFNRKRVDADATAQIRWRPLPSLSFAAVLRGERHGTTTVPLIPAFFADYILYKPWNVVMKASVSKNYRYPSMDDLYFQPGGNPNLQPEKGITYDVGVEWGIKRKVWLFKGNVTFFDSHISDWILWTPDTKGYWHPTNVKKVHNYGIEASANGEVHLAKDTKLSLSVNYAWTPSINKGENANTNDASYGRQLCYVPKYSANANGRLLWRSWTLAAQWSYYSERYTTTSNEVDYITDKLKAYYMTDCSLEKQFRIHQAELLVKLAVNNLFNREYVTVLSRPMPGRNYELYFTLKL